ncbi:DUF6057 family protein [Parabacteroides sp. AM08-6]|uniref:DUF6057 family protein n=1 Tax=Parabacteroides sp. AM08-6 TaxID=2292053 RepID=UPI000F00530E|nr:DUF6057 family protein [Parabacteroides sp. AM08-6]RHJ85389.1 hypothetical protein DW103_04095 [Parabacteroides sp. AM08-6]
MVKKVVLLQGIAIGIFAIACVWFFQSFYSGDFLKGEGNAFLYTIDYFISYGDKPAWLACYAGDFLMSLSTPQGFPYLLTAILLLEWWLIFRILKKFDVGEMAFLFAFFPIMFEWGGYCNSNYLLSSVLSFIISLSVFFEYTQIRNVKASMVFGLLSLPVIYVLAGNRLNTFVILILLYEAGKNRKQWGYWLVLLIACGFLPNLMQHLYHMSGEQAYLYPYYGIPALFPAILFCFSLLLLQIKSIRDMRISISSVSVTIVVLLAALVASIGFYADY